MYAVPLQMMPHWYIHTFLRMKPTSQSTFFSRNSFTTPLAPEQMLANETQKKPMMKT